MSSWRRNSENNFNQNQNSGWNASQTNCFVGMTNWPASPQGSTNNHCNDDFSSRPHNKPPSHNRREVVPHLRNHNHRNRDGFDRNNVGHSHQIVKLSLPLDLLRQKKIFQVTLGSIYDTSKFELALMTYARDRCRRCLVLNTTLGCVGGGCWLLSVVDL